MNKYVYIILFLALVFTSGKTDVKDDTNAKIKAVYLYNFSKYVEWPEEYKSGNFIVTVIGSSPALLAELNKMSEKKVGTQQLIIKTLSSASNVEKSHIIFIPNEGSAQFADAFDKVKKYSTLVVTEKPGLAKQGAVINFITKENKQKFELNKSNAEKFKLKISSNLSALAIPVE